MAAPSRITDKGPHAGLGHPPYGYRKPAGRESDRNAVLVQVPSEKRIIIQIKNWFLSGVSLTAIAERLNAQGVPSPRGKNWWYTVISYLLSNPFYAGTVRFGVTRRQRIRRDGTTRRTAGKPVEAPGRHIPLWDETTHQRILAELEARGQAYPGVSIRPLSRLLRCWCGKVMWAQSVPDGAYWRCSSLTKHHAYISDSAALDAVIDKLVESLKHVDNLQFPTPEDARPALVEILRDLKARRKRWADLFENGDLDAADFTERIRRLDEQIARTEKDIARIETDLTAATVTKDNLHQLAKSVKTLPDYIRSGPPESINAQLHGILKSVSVSKDKEIELIWR